LHEDIRIAGFEVDMGLPARGPERLIDAGVHAGPPGETDERSLAEVFQGDGRARGEWITRADRGDDRLVDDDLGVDSRRRRRQTDQRHVQLPFSQRVEQAVGVGLGKGDLDGRVLWESASKSDRTTAKPDVTIPTATRPRISPANSSTATAASAARGYGSTAAPTSESQPPDHYTDGSLIAGT
jgi:hypothetical protein